MTELIEIDGTTGGGQVLRTALALSAATGRGFHLTNVRGRRPRPGLKRQHLAAVNAAAKLALAEVTGATLNSTDVTFVPHGIAAGDLTIDIGSGGSVCLLLQAVLPVWAVHAPVGSLLEVKGGTVGPMAPSWAFFHETLEPALADMGYGLRGELVRPGFHAVGGGEVRVTQQAAFSPVPFEDTSLIEPGDLTAEIVIACLNPAIAEREAMVIRRRTGVEAEIRLDIDADGAGNAVFLRLPSARRTTVFAASGELGVSAENVAARAVQDAEVFRRRRCPVERHLADQLIVPAMLADGAVFLTSAASAHLRSCADVARRFADRPVAIEPAEGGVLVTVPPLSI